jgi:hypothetical protein
MATNSSEDSNNFLKSLIRKDFLIPPKEFRRGSNISEYIRNVEYFCTAINASKDDKLYILINNLHDEIKYEIFALSDYDQNNNSYEWVKAKLLELFKDRTSEVSPLLKLLELRQEPSQSIREFIGCLRVRAFTLMGHDNPELREKFLIRAFIRGLLDKNMAIAVKACEPKTIEEAFHIIKREKVNLDSGKTCSNAEKGDYVYAIQNKQKIESDQINQLRSDIAMLKEQIKYLIAIVNNKSNIKKYPTKEYEQKSKPPLKCFNCQGIGHLSKYCSKKCSLCNGINHTSYNCNRRNKNYGTNREKLRLLSDEQSENSINNNTSSLISEDENLHCISEIVNKNVKPTYSNIVKQKRGVIDLKDKSIEKQWADYIEGRRSKPKIQLCNNYKPTLITNRRSELARNKPIAECRCENEVVKAFFDTGAECNVISNHLFQKLQVKNKYIRFIEKNSRIKCANGSTMNCTGIVWLTMEIGDSVAKEFRI